MKTAYSPPNISVVIPVYNSMHYMADAINSVLQQSYSSIEVLIVNDASTDDTRAIVQELLTTDSRIKQIDHPHNKGVAAARNTGVRNSLGRFIAFLDSDDIWHPDKMLDQVMLLCSSPSKTGLVYCWSRDFDEQGYALLFANRYKYRGDILNDILLRFTLGGGSSPLIRREVFDKVGGFDESLLLMSEDAEFYLRVAKEYDIDYVPRVLLGYRKRPNSRSSDINGMAVASRAVRDKYASAEMKKKLDDNVAKIYLLNAFTLEKISIKERLEYLKKTSGYKTYLDSRVPLLVLKKMVRVGYTALRKLLPYQRKTLMQHWVEKAIGKTPQTQSIVDDDAARPNVSIVIPSFNSSRYLPDCLGSVTTQDYPNVEIIIVDDGSDDDTASVVKELCAQDNRIKLITNKTNLGVCASRNIGIKAAGSELIIMLDSDDMLAAAAVEKLITKIRQSESIVMVYGARLILNSTGKFQQSTSGALTEPKTTLNNALTTSSLVGLGGGFIFRRTKADADEFYYDEEMRHSGSESFADQLFYTQLANRGEIASIADVVVGYRTGRSDSMSSNIDGLASSFEYFSDRFSDAAVDVGTRKKLTYARTHFYWSHAIRSIPEYGYRKSIELVRACRQQKMSAVFDVSISVGIYFVRKFIKKYTGRRSENIEMSFMKTLAADRHISDAYPVTKSKTKF